MRLGIESVRMGSVEITGGQLTLRRLSYECYASVLHHPESDHRSIDKPAAATVDPTAAEAASPRSVHNDMHSALFRSVTMEINEFSKRGGNLSQTAAIRLYSLRILNLLVLQ